VAQDEGPDFKPQDRQKICIYIIIK
jgi:hypothetical protein